MGADGTSTFILGGQVGDEAPDIYLVYPQGNYIRASDDLPYLQIGETKFGKLMLDLAVVRRARHRPGREDGRVVDDQHRPRQPLGGAARTTSASTATAGGSVLEEGRLHPDSPSLAELSHAWLSHLVAGVHSLPPLVFDDQDRDGPGSSLH